MDLTDRIYFAVHVALTILILVRPQAVEHWPYLIAWNLAAIAAILLLARMQHRNTIWEFAHDFLPGLVFFTAVFEEVSLLCRSVVGQWQNAHLIALEAALFPMPPFVWLQQHIPHWAVEILDMGYFAFYPMYPIVGLLFWGLRKRRAYQQAFRNMTDALSIGYVICYVTFIAWPVQSPRHAGSVVPAARTGLFSSLIRLIQSNGGVHGNAFPSAHIMLAFVVLVFVWYYWRAAAPWLLAVNVLMCLGAIYDGYHYALDVIAGAILGSAVGISYFAMQQRRATP